jgi:hypothetical protein
MKMNVKMIRQIIKDNNLGLNCKARTNGVITVESNNNQDEITTLDNLLNGFGYKLNSRIQDNDFDVAVKV